MLNLKMSLILYVFEISGSSTESGRLLILFFHLFPGHVFIVGSCSSGTFVYIRSVSVVPKCSQVMNHWLGSPHAKQIGRDFPKVVIDILATLNGLGSTPINH